MNIIIFNNPIEKETGHLYTIYRVRLFSSLKVVRSSDRFCSNYVSREYSEPFVFSLWFLFFGSTTNRDKTKRDERNEITTQIKLIIENQYPSIVLTVHFTIHVLIYVYYYVRNNLEAGRFCVAFVHSIHHRCVQDQTAFSFHECYDTT